MNCHCGFQRIDVCTRTVDGQSLMTVDAHLKGVRDDGLDGMEKEIEPMWENVGMLWIIGASTQTLVSLASHQADGHFD
jgi:hypothetical protein